MIASELICFKLRFSGLFRLHNSFNLWAIFWIKNFRSDFESNKFGDPIGDSWYNLYLL